MHGSTGVAYHFCAYHIFVGKFDEIGNSDSIDYNQHILVWVHILYTPQICSISCLISKVRNYYIVLFRGYKVVVYNIDNITISY